jgi:hypothetical protein
VAVGILVLAHVNPDFTVSYLNRKTGDVISPLVESPSALKIEASMVPVAGQNAVFNGPTIKRETQMRAAVIDRVVISIMGKKRDGVSGYLDSQAALFIYIGDRSSTNIFRS